MTKISELPNHVAGESDINIDVMPVVENSQTRKITLEELRQQIDSPVFVHSAIPNASTSSLGTPEELYAVTVPAGVFGPGDVIWISTAWFPNEGTGVGMNTYGIFRDAGGDASAPFLNINLDGTERLFRRAPVELTSNTAQQFPAATDPTPTGIITDPYGLALNADITGTFDIVFRGTSDAANGNVVLHQVFIQGFKST